MVIKVVISQMSCVVLKDLIQINFKEKVLHVSLEDRFVNNLKRVGIDYNTIIRKNEKKVKIKDIENGWIKTNHHVIAYTIEKINWRKILDVPTDNFVDWTRVVVITIAQKGRIETTYLEHWYNYLATMIILISIIVSHQIV